MLRTLLAVSLLLSADALVPGPILVRRALFVARHDAPFLPANAPRASASALALGAGSVSSSQALLSQALGLNSALAAFGLAKEQKMLTTSGLVHAWALGVILWSTLGWRGWSTCVVYLLFGSAVTKVRKEKKEALGIAEGRGGRRGPENVWGSAATAAACAMGSVFMSAQRPALLVGFVASLATKLSDTFASEIGKAYGKTTYLITTFKPVPPGTEGAVSAEGTTAGVVGSLIIALYAWASGLVGVRSLLPCLVAAFVATTCESLIGAGFQDNYAWLTNEVVNFINTLIGGAVGAGLFLLAGTMLP